MQSLTTTRNYLFEQKLSTGSSKFFIYFPRKKMAVYEDGSIVKMTFFFQKLEATEGVNYSFKNQKGIISCSLKERVYLTDETIDILENKYLARGKTATFAKKIFGSLQPH